MSRPPGLGAAWVLELGPENNEFYEGALVSVVTELHDEFYEGADSGG